VGGRTRSRSRRAKYVKLAAVALRPPVAACEKLVPLCRTVSAPTHTHTERENRRAHLDVAHVGKVAHHRKPKQDAAARRKVQRQTRRIALQPLVTPKRRTRHICASENRSVCVCVSETERQRTGQHACHAAGVRAEIGACGARAIVRAHTCALVVTKWKTVSQSGNTRVKENTPGCH
jgi:hypothetical protein